MDEVPGLLLAVVEMDVLLVVLRGQVRGLQVRVVVLLEGLIVGTVPVQTALVDRWVAVRGLDLWVMRKWVVVVVVVILQHGWPCPNKAHTPSWLATTTTVQACSVHAAQEGSRLAKVLEGQGEFAKG